MDTGASHNHDTHRDPPVPAPPAVPGYLQLLDPEAMAKINRIEVLARHPVEGFIRKVQVLRIAHRQMRCQTKSRQTLTSVVNSAFG